jgi:hypothetical protein
MLFSRFANTRAASIGMTELGFGVVVVVNLAQIVSLRLEEAA